MLGSALGAKGTSMKESFAILSWENPKQLLTTLLSLLQKFLLVFQSTCIFLLHKSKLRRYCYLVPCSLIGGNRVKMLLLCLMSIRSMYHSYILNFHAKIRDCENWELVKASFNRFSQRFVWQMVLFSYMKFDAIWWQTARPSLYLQAFANSQFSQSLIFARKFKI